MIYKSTVGSSFVAEKRSFPRKLNFQSCLISKSCFSAGSCLMLKLSRLRRSKETSLNFSSQPAHKSKTGSISAQTELVGMLAWTQFATACPLLDFEIIVSHALFLLGAILGGGRQHLATVSVTMRREISAVRYEISPKYDFTVVLWRCADGFSLWRCR